MKILLINPSLLNTNVSHYSKGLEKNRGIYPSLGLGYIASALIEDGHIVFVVDWDASYNGWEQTQAIMERMRPDIVGFYLMTWTFRNSLMILDAIKGLNPNIISMSGGPQDS